MDEDGAGPQFITVDTENGTNVGQGFWPPLGGVGQDDWPPLAGSFSGVKGSRVPLSDVALSALLLSTSLASVGTAVRASDQNGEFVFFMRDGIGVTAEELAAADEEIARLGMAAEDVDVTA